MIKREKILEKINPIKEQFIDIYRIINNSGISYSLKFEDEIDVSANIEINTSIINLVEVIVSIENNKSIQIDELNALYNEYLTHKESLKNAMNRSGKNRNIYLRNAMILNNDIIARLITNKINLKGSDL